MRTAVLTIAAAALILLIGRSGWAVPEPSITPVSWQLDFRFEDPQRIVIKLPGEKTARTYWYVLYEVINRSGQDVQFHPDFTLVTSTMQVSRADLGVDKEVYEAIKARHAQQYPFMTDPISAMGRLLQGEDNARTSVAIWKQFDLEANALTIYVGGLSGETQRIKNPNYDPSKPETITKTLPNGTKIEVSVNPQQFILEKTLAIPYTLPGDPQTRQTVSPERGYRRWIMR